MCSSYARPTMFPESERVLFRRNRLFKLKELNGMGEARLGVRNDTLTIVVGQCQFELPVAHGGKWMHWLGI